MRISLKKIFVMAAFGVVVGCAPGTTGGDGGVEAECASDTDCPDSEQCHPGLGTCVQDCTLDDADACGAEAPVCNEADADTGEYPLEVADPDADQAYRLLCICIEDGDCGSGEICDPDTRECIAGDAGDSGTPDECTIETEVADCGEDSFCIDGACQAQCVDSDCVVDGDLCLYDDSDPSFNQCVAADDVTTCALAAGASAQSGADDIVIYFVETLLDPEADGCSVGGTSFNLRTYLLSIYSEEDLTGADAQDVLFRPGFDAGNEKFFEDPGTIDSVIEPLAGFEDEYTATVYICGNPDEAAAQIDTGTNVSNSYCFDPLADPL